MRLIPALLGSTLSLFLAGITVGGPPPDPVYNITDLHPDGEAILWSRAVAINENGQIAANVEFKSIVGPAFSYAYRTDNKSKIDLDTDYLGSLGGRSLLAADINELGQVVGTEDFSNDWSITHAFRTGPSAPINPLTDDLGTFGGIRSEAWAINDSGQVAGLSLLGTGMQRAYRTAPDSAIAAGDNLGTLGGTFSSGYGINNAGQVVGASNTAATSGTIRAFRTAPNAAINPATDNLGAFLPNGTMSEGLDVNEAGQVVGWGRSTTFLSHAALHDGLALIDLGTLGGNESRAEAINNHGQIVGSSSILPGQPGLIHAFLWENGVMYDLNDLIDPLSGWVLESAMDINDKGQIVGYGMFGDEQHAFVLTLIPEPATLCLLVLGAAWIGLRRRTTRTAG